jgi:hypothetical protein
MSVERGLVDGRLNPMSADSEGGRVDGARREKSMSAEGGRVDGRLAERLAELSYWDMALRDSELLGAELVERWLDGGRNAEPRSPKAGRGSRMMAN